MTLGDYLAIALVVLSSVIALAGFWLAAAAIWPCRVERCRKLCERGVLKSFLIGLVPFGVAIIVCIRVIQVGGPASALGLVLLGFVVFFCQVGVAGLAEHIGSKLSPAGTEKWVCCRRGGGTLAATFLVPVVGWVLMFLVVTTLGCGVILRTLFAREDRLIAKDGAPEKVGGEAEITA